MDYCIQGERLSDYPGLQEVADRYETWRRRWLSTTGIESSRGSPEFSDRCLWFRNGYPYPDWTATIIEPSHLGFLVLSATTERRNSPLIAVEAVFTRLEDAGKYVLAFFGDMLRLECKLEPLYRQWRRAGICSCLEKGTAEQQVVEFIANYNGVSRDVIDRLTHKYWVKAEPERYAHLSSFDEPTSRVLTMSYNELDVMLTEGLGVGK
ncbi:hypothetical protein [Mycobacterium riyadhense]|uniref:hypothetical protein n=1 Tax=Mycobacterium riyadhense TaxID=486698 RepID=UPI0019500242|nr:hypothetical protein [Mycobacterium riyadhense]